VSDSRRRIVGGALICAVVIGCAGATGKDGLHSSDPTERGCSYIAASILTSAIIRAFFNK
jgi:hypothetical protein